MAVHVTNQNSILLLQNVEHLNLRLSKSLGGLRRHGHHTNGLGIFDVF